MQMFTIECNSISDNMLESHTSGNKHWLPQGGSIVMIYCYRQMNNAYVATIICCWTSSLIIKPFNWMVLANVLLLR